MKNKHVDILIVGAGASGAAAAWNLSSKNYKIVCLEQGPWLKKSSYSFDRPDWEKMSDDGMNKFLKFCLFCIFAFFSYHFVIAVIDRFFG